MFLALSIGAPKPFHGTEQALARGQQECEHGLAVLELPPVHAGKSLARIQLDGFDLLIRLQPLSDAGQTPGDEGVHEFIGHTGGGVECSQRIHARGTKSGFFLQFAGRAMQGFFAFLQCSGGEFEQQAIERDPEVSDEQEECGPVGLRRPEYGKDNNRAGVPDDLAAHDGPIPRSYGDGFEVELRSPMDQLTFNGVLHARDHRWMSTDASAQPGTPTSASPMVRLVRVVKQFGTQVVLNGVSADFREGETTVVLGPSGSGKSVLLKHIAGLLRPDAGEVYFRSQRIDRLSESRLAPIRRQIGFLFQLSALFDSMTVRENLEFPLQEHTGLSARERAAEVAAALRRVDLVGVEDKFPAELSGGQQKRVALARAIILKPALILYDEPTTGLDPVRADGINQLIRRLQGELGVTSIVVTHDLTSAKKVADRVIMIHGGVVIADGTLSDVEACEDEHVRNFLAGRYDPSEDALAGAAGVADEAPRPSTRDAKSGRKL